MIRVKNQPLTGATLYLGSQGIDGEGGGESDGSRRSEFQ